MSRQTSSAFKLRICFTTGAIVLCIILMFLVFSRRNEPSSGLLSLDSGIYSSKTLKITVRAPQGCTISYTTDGSYPHAEQTTGRNKIILRLSRSMSGTLVSHAEEMAYPSKFVMHDSDTLPYGVVLRVAVIDQEGNVQEQKTAVYLFGEKLHERWANCLIVSLALDPADLLDYERGILVKGAIYDRWKETKYAKEILNTINEWEIESNISQHGRAWERPALMQIYDPGAVVPSVEAPCGVRVQGNSSRVFSQRSFNLYFRKEYGVTSLDYYLFDHVGKYESFTLRNGGNDTNYLKFKDTLLQSLLRDRDFVIQSSRPAILFLNGEYWGPYCLNEIISDRFIQEHYGIDADNVVLFKDGALEDGTDSDQLLYDELLSFVKKDLSVSENYNAFCQMMDVQSMADYCAAQIYIGNADWKLGRNEALWRLRDRSFNEGRWKYILYDTEFSSGLYDSADTSVDRNHFQLALENHPLFASAMQNPSFQSLFLNALHTIGMQNLSYDQVCDTLDSYEAQWKPLMQDYYLRFGNYSFFWENNLQTIRLFFRNRYEIIIPMVEKYLTAIQILPNSIGTLSSS